MMLITDRAFMDKYILESCEHGTLHIVDHHTISKGYLHNSIYDHYVYVLKSTNRFFKNGSNIVDG